MLDSLVDLAVVPGKSRSLKGMKTGAECGKIDQRASIIQAVLWIQKFQNSSQGLFQRNFPDASDHAVSAIPSALVIVTLKALPDTVIFA